METLRSSNRTVCISTPVLAEDSTPENPVLSLIAILDQLGEGAKQNDYLVGLLLVLLAESGFRTASHLSDAAYYERSLAKDHRDTYGTEIRGFYSSNIYSSLRSKHAESVDNSSKFADDASESATNFAEPVTHSSFSASNTSKSDQNTRIVYIPRNWKSLQTDRYEIPLLLRNAKNVQSKLIVVPCGDKMILNMVSCTEQKITYSLIVKTSDYVNLNSTKLYDCYINLQEISHRFKDILATPVRTDILSSFGLMNPSLQGLPVELQEQIVQYLSGIAVMCLAQCSRGFSEICSEPLIWQTLICKDFYPCLDFSEQTPEIPRNIKNARERYLEALRSMISAHTDCFKKKEHLLYIAESNESFMKKLFMRRPDSESYKRLHPKYFDHTINKLLTDDALFQYYYTYELHDSPYPRKQKPRYYKDDKTGEYKILDISPEYNGAYLGHLYDSHSFESYDVVESCCLGYGLSIPLLERNLEY